jgi:hypothetical protein
LINFNFYEDIVNNKIQIPKLDKKESIKDETLHNKQINEENIKNKYLIII